jgi:hypothetical protein
MEILKGLWQFLVGLAICAVPFILWLDMTW